MNESVYSHFETGQITLGIAPQPAIRKKTVFNKQLAKRLYRQHNAYVMHVCKLNTSISIDFVQYEIFSSFYQSAPKDKLLVYMCSDGWSPLCKFLGIPVPDEPFPHKNKGGSFVQSATREFPVFRKIRREMIQSSVVYTSITIITGVCLYKYGLAGIFHYASSYVDQAMRTIGLL